MRSTRFKAHASIRLPTKVQQQRLHRVIREELTPLQREAIVSYYFQEMTMEAIARDQAPEPVVSIEDIAVKDPDKSKWESFCGKYEHREDADFIVDEVFLRNDELYAKAIDEDGDEIEFMLYPIGENEFGRKGGMIKLTFSNSCVAYAELTCKKL